MKFAYWYRYSQTVTVSNTVTYATCCLNNWTVSSREFIAQDQIYLSRGNNFGMESDARIQVGYENSLEEKHGPLEEINRRRVRENKQKTSGRETRATGRNKQKTSTRTTICSEKCDRH